MAKHAKQALPKTENATADNDCYVDIPNVCNTDAKLAKLTCKRHDNEARSVQFSYTGAFRVHLVL